MTKQELFDKADYYKGLIDRRRPFDAEKRKQLDNCVRIGFTFSSNSLEGNTLTIEDTKTLLEAGVAAGKKPDKDYYEAAGHAEACDYMLSAAGTGKLDITETIIKRLHYLFYHKVDEEEAGEYRKIPAFIASAPGYQPPGPEDVPHLMEHFINQMQSSNSLMHPIEFAAICHKRLLDIHPFRDGNGQTARLLMNLILENAGYGITPIFPELRREYTDALAMSRRKGNPDIDILIKFVAGCVIEAERDYCRLLGIE